MFGPITVPFGAKMLFNTVKLRSGVDQDDVDVALAEMCNVVKGQQSRSCPLRRGADH